MTGEVSLRNIKPVSIEVEIALPGTNHSVAVCKDLETSLLQGRPKGRFKCRGSSVETGTRFPWLLSVFCYVALRMIEILFEKVRGALRS